MIFNCIAIYRSRCDKIRLNNMSIQSNIYLDRSLIAAGLLLPSSIRFFYSPAATMYIVGQGNRSRK